MKIKTKSFEIRLPYEKAEIDRVHRIGKAYENENSALTMKPIIIKFKSWRYRQDVHRNGPRRFENVKKKPGENCSSVSLDLTKPRYNLLKISQGIVTEMDLFMLKLIVPLPYVLKMVLLNILAVSMSSIH